MAAPAYANPADEIKKRIAAQYDPNATQDPQAATPDFAVPDAAPFASIEQSALGPKAATFQSAPVQAMPGPEQVPQTDKGPVGIGPAPVNYAAAANTSAPAVEPTKVAVGPAQTTNAAANPGDIDAVNAFYQKYLGRAANPDDAEKWLSGAYGYGTDLATIEQAIANSPEAQARKGGGAGGGGSVDDAVAANYKALGVTPTGAGTGPTDIAYFIRRINETGGLTEQNKAYWFGPNGRIARELRGEVAPEKGAAETPGGGGGVPAGPAGPSGPAPPAGPDPYAEFLKKLQADRDKDQASRDEVKKILMDRLRKAGMPVDENSLEISQPLAAARDETQRAQQQERTALAERLYAQGGGHLNTGELGQSIQQSAERNAGGLSNLRAGLISNQYGQKLNEMQGLLQMAMASGDTQSAQLLQAQIAALQGAINREGMGISLAEFLANLNRSTVSAGAGG